MNKRLILIPIVIILAGVLGYAAVSYHSSHAQPVTQEPAASKQMAAGEPSPGDRQGGPMSMNPEAVPKADEGKGKPSKMKPNDGQKKAQKGKPGQDASAFRQQHKQMFGLMNTFLALAAIERGGKSTLTPVQAKQVLSIMTPLKAQPKLTEAEAGKTLARLNKILTADQLKAMSAFKSPGRNGQKPDQRQHAGPPPGATGQRPPQGAPPPGQDGMRRQGPPPGSPPRVAGQKPPQGAPPSGSPPRVPGQQQGPQFDPAAMNDFNPFYTGAPTGGGAGPAMGKRMERFFDALKKKAGVS